MASWDRMVHDSQGRIFVPMNVDATSDNDSFLTIPKGITIISIIIAYVALIAWGTSTGLTIFGWIICLAFVTFVSQLLLRYIVFQETYFYKLWRKEKELGTPKASRFWSIASIRKTPSGDVLVFQDLKVGVLIELERDTIIGRAVDNKERHYDAWSECYRAAITMGLNIAQLNLMQPAGRDERFNEMSDLASRATNKNVRRLLEINTGHMRNISSNTLDEHDYLLIYSKNINKIDSILMEALEAVSYLMDGAYVGARVLTESEVYQLPRENFNVKFFDGVEAQMSVYRGSGVQMKVPFKIRRIEFEGDKRVTMNPQLNSKIEEAVKLLNNEQIPYAEWSVLDALGGKWSSQYRSATNRVIKFDDGEEAVIGDTDPQPPRQSTRPSQKKKGFSLKKSQDTKDLELDTAIEAEETGNTTDKPLHRKPKQMATKEENSKKGKLGLKRKSKPLQKRKGRQDDIDEPEINEGGFSDTEQGDHDPNIDNMSDEDFDNMPLF